MRNFINIIEGANGNSDSIRIEAEEHPYSGRYGEVVVRAYDGDQEVGAAFGVLTGETEMMTRRKMVQVADVKVHEDYRRRGIASRMYDKIEELGYFVEPWDGGQSKDGKAFWNRFTHTSRARDELRKKLDTKLDESKQVGVLYHFTDLHKGWAILEEKKLKIGDKKGSFRAMGGMFMMTQPRTHISLTRNPRLTKTARVGGNGEPWNVVRIMLDGDKLAQRNRIEPYNDSVHGISRHDGQAEERIAKDEVDITGCVIQVDFAYFEFLRLENDFSNWTYPPSEEQKAQRMQFARQDASLFAREMRKLGYTFNIVRKF